MQFDSYILPPLININHCIQVEAILVCYIDLIATLNPTHHVSHNLNIPSYCNDYLKRSFS